MKAAPVLFGFAGMLAGIAATSAGPQQWVLLVSGDHAGYLSPCGCADPMIGGIKRLASAVASAKGAAFVYSGGLVAGTSRQDELKAETLAESLAQMKVAAIGVGPQDLRLGKAFLAQLDQLSGDKFVSASFEPGDSNPFRKAAFPAPFAFTSIVAGAEELSRGFGDAPVATADALEGFISTAQRHRLVPIVAIDGGLAAARAIARSHPRLRVVIYKSLGSPAESLAMEGGTALVTPGDNGKHLLRIASTSRGMSYQAIALGPSYPDRADVDRTYRGYLERVEEEKLLERLPRAATREYAGSGECLKCHPSEHAKWATSSHADALETLERDGHDRDPDCVGCHVTGLASKSGFRSGEETPTLASVGCESCHGPAADHVRNPEAFTPRAGGKASCMKCHVPSNSPGFDFQQYWRKIAH